MANDTNTPAVQLRGVGKTYVSDRVNFEALCGVSLTIDKGSFNAVVGRSGSGKSTLMNLITGIDRPTSGEIAVLGMPINHLSESKAAKWRGIHIGVVFQFFQLMPTLTVIENVMLPMDFCRRLRFGERRRRALSLLEKCGIADQAHKLPASLSGGQQQRAALARALANDPPLIVADEPTGNLDSATADGMYSMLRSLAAEGKTLVVVSHDPEIAKIADNVITIADGRIVHQEGTL